VGGAVNWGVQCGEVYRADKKTAGKNSPRLHP